jgi:N-methylhydantoinase A
MLHSDLRYDNVRTWLRVLDEASFDEISAIYQELAEAGRRSLEDSKVQSAQVTVTYAADMRYVGQEHPVTVELSAGVIEAWDRDTIKRQFDDVHRQRYGTSAPEPAEIVSLRASVSGMLVKPAIKDVPAADLDPDPACLSGERDVYFGSRYGRVRTPVYGRDGLMAGNGISGPALVEEHASTTVLLPGDRLEVDRLGNLVIQTRGQS